MAVWRTEVTMSPIQVLSSLTIPFHFHNQELLRPHQVKHQVSSSRGIKKGCAQGGTVCPDGLATKPLSLQGSALPSSFSIPKRIWSDPFVLSISKAQGDRAEVLSSDSWRNPLDRTGSQGRVHSARRGRGGALGPVGRSKRKGRRSSPRKERPRDRLDPSTRRWPLCLVVTGPAGRPH